LFFPPLYSFRMRTEEGKKRRADLFLFFLLRCDSFLEQISCVQLDEQRVMISYYCKADPFEGESRFRLARKRETDASFFRFFLLLPVKSNRWLRSLGWFVHPPFLRLQSSSEVQRADLCFSFQLEWELASRSRCSTSHLLQASRREPWRCWRGGLGWETNRREGWRGSDFDMMVRSRLQRERRDES